MGAPAEILELVERFERNREAYLAGRYNEAQLRREFIDPMFAALGWDVHNTQGYAEAYKDVIHEDSIKIGSATKAPDNCFRIGGTRKFFLEAKKPSVDIKGDPGPAYQLRRYAWSAKLPLSILTDFEEFAVYDCRMQPYQKDSPVKARLMYLTYKDYIEKWDEIASIFSRDAVLKGSFDKYVKETLNKKGTCEVDEAFLVEIENWRDLLAHNVALRNPQLDGRGLNFTVQITIDRIIFLRICEDRGLERYGELQALLNGQDVYARLLGLFRKADDRYNSGLFHFSSEKGRDETPDELTPGLAIDDKVLKDILRRLYYPDSPYEFSALPAEILGQVYEQFLGKVITLTAGHRAKVEEKPEVKKAGGVFYTPSYIVDYIVHNTIGHLVGGKTPKDVEKIKVLDPACGSGSFLLGAYQYLLDWHLNYYLEHDPKQWMKKKNPPICESVTPSPASGGYSPFAGGELSESASGDKLLAEGTLSGEHTGSPLRGKSRQDAGGTKGYKLTGAERKRILLNNIYGVDIDAQAVEVTKLSLLLKVLEGERQLVLIHKERALPDLAHNIKCGNSLIGPDFYHNGHQLTMFDEEQQYKINAFDWKSEFADVFKGKNPGFDAVIGNPPYIRIQTMKDTQPESVEYFGKTYKSAAKGNYDIYVVFVEKASSLLTNTGKLGFIVPNKFLCTDYGLPIRNYLIRSGLLSKIVDFGHDQVFGNATIYTCLLFLDREKHREIDYQLAKIAPPNFCLSGLVSVPLRSLDEKPWQFLNRTEEAIKSKLFSSSVPLLGLPCHISRGSSTGDDKVFSIVKKRGYFVSDDNTQVKLEKEILRKPLYAKDFSRYSFSCCHDEYLIFPYFETSKGYELYEESVLKKKFPHAYAYLEKNKARLKKRKQYQQWYGFSAPRNLALHDKADIIVPLLANKGLFSVAPKNIKDYCLMASGGFSLCVANENYSSLYLLGLLNSKLLFWYLKNISNVFRSGWITCTKQYFGQLPIRTINFSDKKEKSVYDKLVSLVEVLLELHKKLSAVKTPDEKTRLTRQIAATDGQIDGLVYELYGLTEEEISIVEGGD
jgi:hypothetical protein